MSKVINITVDQDQFMILAEAFAVLSFYQAAYPKLSEEQAKIADDLVKELKNKAEENGWLS